MYSITDYFTGKKVKKKQNCVMTNTYLHYKINDAKINIGTKNTIIDGIKVNTAIRTGEHYTA